MEDVKIKLSETVMLIDTAYFNFVMDDLKKYFEPMLGRMFPQMDLSLFMMNMAVDSGIREGKNEVQVLLVYDEASKKLRHCVPSDLKQELDGVAFNSPLGEFSFLAVPSEGFVSRGELILDLLQIVQSAKEVKKVVVATFNEEYGEEVEKALKDFTDKEVIQFRMEKPSASVNYRWEMLAYPLMASLGIKSEDLQRN